MNNLLSPSEIAAKTRVSSSPPVLCVLIGCGSYNPMTTAHVGMFTAAKEHLESTTSSNSAEDGRAQHIVIGAFASPVSDHYKKADLAPFPHRLAAGKKCIEAFPSVSSWLVMDDWEGSQAQYTRTYYVLESISNRVKAKYIKDAQSSSSDTTLPKIDVTKIRTYFVCGGDLFETFYRPGVWDLTLLGGIFKTFHLCVAARVGSKHPKAVIQDFKEPLIDPKDANITLDLREYESRVDVFELPPNETSSTKVRALLREVVSSKGKDDKDDSEEVIRLLGSMLPEGCIEYLLHNKVYAPLPPPLTTAAV